MAAKRKNKRPPLIAVIGDTECAPAVERAAEETGRLIARRGGIVVTGGYGGVMEAACRGARKAGGTTIGILSGKHASEANRWIGIPIVTGMGHARNAVIALTADGIVAVGGAFGTLSEIAYALRFGKPLVGIRSWKLEHHGSCPEVRFPDCPDAAAAISLLFRRLKR